LATISFLSATASTISVRISHNGNMVNKWELFRDGTSQSSSNFTASTTHTADKSVSCPNADTYYTIKVVYYYGTTKVHEAEGSFKTASLPAPDTTAPSTPTGVTSTSKAKTSISLTWSPSTDNVGVTGYEVYVNGNYKDSTSGTSMTVSGLTPGVQYGFSVKAYDAAGNKSGMSTTVYATTETNPKPTAPSNLMSTAQTTNSISISWGSSTDDDGVSGYNIYMNGSFYNSISGTSATIFPLDENTTYSFYVVAYDPYGAGSPPSNTISVKTLATAPTQVVVTSRYEGGFNLSWGSFPNATQYELNYKAAVNSVWIQSTKTTTSTSLNLDYGLQFDFKVRAYANGSWSNFSNVTQAFVNPKTPTLSGEYTGTSSTVTLTVGGMLGTKFDSVIIERFLRSNNSLVDSKTTTVNGGYGQWTIASTDIGKYYFRAKSSLNANGTTIYSVNNSQIVEFLRPIDFNWTYAKTSGQPFNLTAKEWNDLTLKINEFRVNYKGLSSYTFTTAYSGSTFTAAMFNQAVIAIGAMTNSSYLPTQKNSGESINASYLIGLTDALKSIP